MKTLKCFSTASIAALALAALLVTSSTAVAGPIKARKERQQDRISQGVKSGQLTARETSRIEKKEASLNQEERDMRKIDNGKLTNKDRRTFDQQQNQLSRDIYRQKHDAQTQPH